MKLLYAALASCISGAALAGPSYIPPTQSKTVLQSVDFDSTTLLDAKLRSLYAECDAKNTCDGKPLTYGCKDDQNKNSVILKFPSGAVFYDAKMGLDADGSPYSMSTPGETDQPQTSLRFPLPGNPSVNSDRVPFVVIPQGDFASVTGVRVGDVAAVVYGNKKIYAVIADVGPKCKIGEGSIQLHELAGHNVCKARNEPGDCTKLRDVGIEKDVLYFLFPGTAEKLGKDLSPENINSRINDIGAHAWKAQFEK